METAEAEGPTAPAAIIETAGLIKRYGPAVALQDCSLQVLPREVFGLLGVNGAGKTTLLRLLLGFLRPTAGTARIAGFDCYAQSLEVRRRVAYLPGEARLFRGMRGWDVLSFFSRLRGQDARHAEHVAQRLELNVSERVASMSTGMRQKLALASALAADTPVVILDEPTSNLDPSARAAVLELVRDARLAGRTVVFSSHVLAEVEEVCDRVAIIRAGRLVHTQVLAELRRGHRIRARLTGPLTPIPLELQPAVSLRHEADESITIDAPGELPALFGWLATMPLAEVRVDPVGLRTVYDAFHGGRTRTPNEETGSS